MPTQPGDLLAGRFEILELARSGGMGTVYRALDRSVGGTVAIKVPSASGVARERLLEEGAVLSQIDHPGVVRYVAHGVTEHSLPFLAMEWLEGETLSERLAGDGLDLDEARALIARLADVLAAVHELGIVHRDVKPSNVLLPTGDVAFAKLVDFGVAHRRASGLADTTQHLGTPAYMSPEQARCDPDIDARADVFALGCVLFRCVTGTLPFVAEHAPVVLAKILLEDAPRLKDKRRGVPEALDELVHLMLAKDRDARPPDGRAIADALAAVDLVCARAQSTMPPQATIGESEQRIVCVLLAGRPRAADVATLRPEVALDLADRVGRAVLRHQARAEALADGSMLVTVSSGGAVTDQAARAARCALAMRPLVPGVPFVLVTGHGVVSRGTMVGSVLDRAAVGLARAHPGAISLDEVTAALLDSRFVVRGTAPDLVLEEERDALSGARTVLGRRASFVGRTAELATLQALFDECVDEKVNRVVLVTGEAGAGKSRLRHELMQQISARRTSGLALLFGAADSLARGSALALAGAVVERWVGAETRDSRSSRADRLLARAREIDASGRVGGFLAELCRLPGAEHEALVAARADPVLMSDELRRAWERFVLHLVTRGPTALVLEDVQWADAASLDFVESALRRVLGLYVVLFARPEVKDRLSERLRDRNVQEIRLGPLVPSAARSVVLGVLGDGAPAGVVERLVERARGNPFCLEELARACATGGDESRLPDTVLGMAQARLDALDADTRRLLRAGSVFGRTFWRGAAIAVAGTPDHTLPEGRWVDELVKREIAHTEPSSQFPGELELVFVHDLLREAAYSMLTSADSTLAHRLAGDWLEAHGEGDALVLAEHFARGADSVQAATWFVKVAERALDGSDLAGAIAAAGSAVDHGEASGRAELLRAIAHRWRGESEPAAITALSAVERLQQGSADWYRALHTAIIATGRLGRDDVWALAARAEETAPGEGASGARVLAIVAAAGHAFQVGRDGDARRFVDVVAEAAERCDPLVRAEYARIRAMGALHEGDPSAYLAANQSALTSYEEAGHVRNACLALGDVAFAYAELGDYEAAESALVQAIRTADDVGADFVGAYGWHNLGAVLTRQGRYADARRAEQRAIRFAIEHGQKRLEAASTVYLANIALGEKDPRGALGEADRALAIACELPTVRALALVARARALLDLDRADEAVEAAEQAHDLLTSDGGLDEGEALVRLVYAEALTATGARDRGRGVIFAARARLLARAGKIADPAWRASFTSRVSEHARTLELSRPDEPHA